MDFMTSYLTQNPCYKQGRPLSVRGLMLHSVGCPQPSAQVFVKNWNSPTFKNACVHGFIDANTGAVYQTLPWTMRGWHAGGAANNTHIGVEMCEPATIKYNGGASYVDLDPVKTKKAILTTYKSAVELFASLCKQFNLDPLKDGVIISHKEGHARGIATNHGDPEHLWKPYGLTMDGFRKDVKSKMEDSHAWSKEAVDWVKANGIMVGNAQGDMMLESPLTREQFIVALYRYEKFKEGRK